METVIKLLIFFFGALWGSFFHTLALRYANGTLVENPFRALFSSSKCPACGKRINKIYLVPILGFLMLRGRCSLCKSKISYEYPLFEVLYGILMLLSVNKYGFNFHSVIIFFILSVAVAISVIDVKTLIIPDSFVIIFLIFSIYPVMINYSIRDNLYGLLLMSVFFILILFVFPGSFGGGDLKYASAIGFFLGLEFSIVALEAALVSGAITGVIYAAGRGRSLKMKIPFGPFLSFGVFVAIFYGREIILYYYSLFY